MKDLNSVTVVGNLTKDVEVRSTSSGMAIQNASIACNDSRKKNGEWSEYTSFFDVTIFGHEGLSQYLVKGQKVGIVGKLDQQRWEKDGQKRSKVVIIANDIELLGGRKDASQGHQSAPQAESAGVYDEDIPF